jgi:hypothetical protein
LSNDGALIFLTRPIALAFLAIGIGVLVLRSLRKNKKPAPTIAMNQGDDA